MFVMRVCTPGPSLGISREGRRLHWSFLGEELLEEPVLPSHLKRGFLTSLGGIWKYLPLLGPG